MKHIVYIFLALLLASCAAKTPEQTLEQRAAELCRYVPDDYQRHWEECKDYLTPDFYALLDTMYSLPDISSVEHQWEWWFIASDGAPVFRCNCQVLAVERLDDTHANATLLVFPEDTVEYIADEHTLSMERINGEWLIADFDARKADCRRYIDTNRNEWAVHQAVAGYLVNETAAHYLHGEICIPVIQFVSVSDTCVYGDFWVYWYNICGDTLKTVSGGNHSGRMTLVSDNGSLRVTAFAQTADGAANEPSAKRIFGSMFDIYENIHSCNGCLEAARENQLREYIRRHSLPVRYLQDFGWPAIDLNVTD